MAALDYLLMPIRQAMTAIGLLPPASYIRFLGSGVTATFNTGAGPGLGPGPGGAATIDVTVNGGGGGSPVALQRTPVNAAGITQAQLLTLVATNAALGALGAWLDVDCSVGPVAIGMPVLPADTPVFIYIINGNPATHAVTLTATVGATIAHQNGPPTATYTPNGPTLQDTPASSGTSAVTNVWVFDAAGYLATTSTYRAVGALGSYTVH